MSHNAWNPVGEPSRGIAGLAERSEALREAAALPDAEPRELLDAAFAELDGAIELLSVWGSGDDTDTGAGDPGAEDRASESLTAERRLLRAVFQRAPVPLFVLAPDGTVRRANSAAGDLIGSAPGYATGRPLVAFVDLASRAALQSQIAAVARTGNTRRLKCKVLGPSGSIGHDLSVSRIELPDGQQLLVVAVGGAFMAAPKRKLDSHERSDPLHRMTRRMDTVSAVTRLLLDNSTFSEAVTLQRCARLLAGHIAGWVIVDVERAEQLRRQFVIGPPGEAAEEMARQVRGIDPQPGTAPWQVHLARKPRLISNADDAKLLGTAADGTSLLMMLGVSSLLIVPIFDGATSYGTLTLARRAQDGRFEIADLALIEEIGEHLGVAMRVDRMFRHRASVAEALQASLLPARLPDIPGLDLSATYLPAGQGLDVSGDFYDVFPVPSLSGAPGWGITIGDVCGKGQEAAAMTAAARHAIRVLAAYGPDPGDVLARANEIILAGDYEDRFVTAKLAYLQWQGRDLAVTLASAGHPGPALVRSDGRVEMLGGGGLPLGLFSSAEQPEAEPALQTLRLHAGDLLFFFSDGVTDARSADKAFFEERLADELAGLAGRSASETARAIQGVLVGFSSDELRDDLTILVARVTGPPE
ncbi:MAG: SpoIIE family protein phosphatase [Streptosporangiaceae bacterium]|nr:SpoIIE family protein phosphatase [Streptosporangiaceae bacterium]